MDDILRSDYWSVGFYAIALYPILVVNFAKKTTRSLSEWLVFGGTSLLLCFTLVALLLDPPSPSQPPMCLAALVLGASVVVISLVNVVKQRTKRAIVSVLSSCIAFSLLVYAILV